MTMPVARFAGVLGFAVVLTTGTAVAADAVLQPLAGAASAPAAPWAVVGLPHQSKPYTRFSIVDLDGKRALRIEADKSYGNLAHPLKVDAASAHLAWQWRVDQPLAQPDLREKQGEDIAVKVCTMWDLPLDQVPFVDRQTLRVARSASDVSLPTATVCYVWDPVLAPDTKLDSPYTRRLRYIVLRGGNDPLRRWTPERRDIGADFLAVFGDESKSVPPLIGVLVGADADNTRGHSVAHVTDLTLEP